MIENYIPVIGLEIHIHSKTKTKMFCSCSTDYFGAEPNTHTCPVCLGLPGALPTINKKAIDNCIKLSLALNCKINTTTKFDRKNYYYPDLPKGFQISQFDKPIGVSGYLEISGGEQKNDSQRIRITRIHQEEDTAKSIHSGAGSAIDCNKAGIPLIEVVTEPDFQNTTQVLEFARKLQQIVRYLDVGEGNMEMGQMRFELNISAKKFDEPGLPKYKVECKNISSISILEKVINFELKRQATQLEKGETPVQETRGIDDKTGETFSQRIKEDSEDYRYFPEPDLPVIKITNEQLEEIRNSIEELPDAKIQRFQSFYKLPFETVALIIDEKFKADWFEEVVKLIGIDENTEEFYECSRNAANFMVGELSFVLKKRGEDFENMKLSKQNFADMMSLLNQNSISGATVKSLISKYLEVSELSNVSITEYVKANGLEQISDVKIISEVVDQVFGRSAKMIEDYKNGKLVAKSALVGQVMGHFKGKANPQVIDEIISEKLNAK